MNMPTFENFDSILENFTNNNEQFCIKYLSRFDTKQVCIILDSKESCIIGNIIPFYGDSLYHIYCIYFSIKGPRLFRMKNDGSDIYLCSSGIGLSIDP